MQSERRLKSKKIIFAIFVSILIFGFFFFIKTEISKAPKDTVCTTEAKLCPDGSSVGRTGPNCEFSACPTGEGKTSYGFGNDQIGQAIADYLVIQKIFAWQTEDGSRNFCVVENLDPDIELFPIYVWARCGEFIFQNDELTELSGVSVPVKIDYPNELSFYDIARFTHEAPGDSAAYTEDIKRIFPENLQQKISNYDSATLSQELKTQSPAWFQREEENDETWEEIKQAISDCKVKSVFQTHSNTAGAELKNGTELSAIEPQIDNILDLALAAEDKCGRIIMSTE